MTVKLVGKRAGVKALLTAPGVVEDIHRRTRKVHAAAGADDHNLYLDDKRFRDRARGAVVTATKKAREAQENNDNLLRALDAARD